MKSFCCAFLFCLLSIIVVIECDDRRSYRRGYKPRLSYAYNDHEYNDQDSPRHSHHFSRYYPKRYANKLDFRPGYTPGYKHNFPYGAHRYAHDYLTHDGHHPRLQQNENKRYPHRYSEGTDFDHDNPSHYDNDNSEHYFRRISSEANRKRGMKEGTLSSLVRGYSSKCFTPLPTEIVEPRYEHPRNSNCNVSFTGGLVYCDGSDVPEPRQRSGTEHIFNPLYEGICENVPARTSVPCYAPINIQAIGGHHVQYEHPTRPDCYVEYESSDVYCDNTKQNLTLRNSEGRRVASPLYSVLCSFYCPKLKPTYCTSASSLSVGQNVTDVHACYKPDPKHLIGKYYKHPRNYFNDTCVVTYELGEVFCNGNEFRGLPPEPRNLSVYNPEQGPFGDIYRDEPNPLYSQICANASAYTTMPCYTPPRAGPGVVNYQHPTVRNCAVSYANGNVTCHGSLKPIEDSANILLYRDLCSTYCLDLLPYLCNSTSPISAVYPVISGSPHTPGRPVILGPPDRDNAECIDPEPEFLINTKYYKHPQKVHNNSCVVSYKEGLVYCYGRQLRGLPHEPPMITVYNPDHGASGRLYTEERNPLYSQICANRTAQTTMPCYSPPPPANPGIIQYRHPTIDNCFVTYGKNEVICDGDLKAFEDNTTWPFYVDLCSTYCPGLLPDYCISVNPYIVSTVSPEITVSTISPHRPESTVSPHRPESTVSPHRPESTVSPHRPESTVNPVVVDPTVEDKLKCYEPDPQVVIGLYYNHPTHHWNNSCVVTYIEGEVFCNHHQLLGLPPEEKVISADQGASSSLELNPLYKEICANAPATTTIPCYTPPPPSSPAVSTYQHPTALNCFVTYANGEVYCDGQLKDSDDDVNAPLYEELCSTFCPKLLPYICKSMHPKPCQTCGTMVSSKR